MKKGFFTLAPILAIPLISLILAPTADAQLLRRIFRPAQQSGCANGQCEVPSQFRGVAQTVPVEAVAAEPAPRSLAAKSFAGALQSQLAASANKGFAERHYLRILNGPDSPRRDRQIARMERLVRAELDLAPSAAIDWQNIDWSAVLRFLLAILPLFL